MCNKDSLFLYVFIEKKPQGEKKEKRDKIE